MRKLSLDDRIRINLVKIELGFYSGDSHIANREWLSIKYLGESIQKPVVQIDTESLKWYIWSPEGSKDNS